MNPLYGKAPSAEKLAKLAAKEAKKAAKKGPAQTEEAAAAGAQAASGDASSTQAAPGLGADYKPKVPKGTRDSTPEEITIREMAFSIIKGVFLSYGAVGIDTPVFELKETLTGKYGEDSKLIYDLADQGGEHCALRYDLTVPFARYIASYSIDNIKRYHIARVYRRDNPAMSKGRFREFYQCDFDIAGTYPLMTADSEALEVLTSILDKLPGIGAYKVKLNHRKLLDGMMQLCGVPADKLRPICSAIDKLDKEPWSVVREEMVCTKCLDPIVADRLEHFVRIHGEPFTVLAQLKLEPGFVEHHLAGQALAELEVLFNYLHAVGRLDRVNFDLSLARGLDYYTGVIYEAAQTGPSAVGSIAAGGRYDNLVGMFSAKEVPAVGVSIGIERILNIVEQAVKLDQGMIRRTHTQVLVGSIGEGFYLARKKLSAELRELGIATDNLNDITPTYKKQTDFAKKNSIRYFIIMDEEAKEKGQVKLKDRDTDVELLVPIGTVAKTLKKIIRITKETKEADDADGVEQATVQAFTKMQL